MYSSSNYFSSRHYEYSSSLLLWQCFLDFFSSKVLFFKQSALHDSMQASFQLLLFLVQFEMKGCIMFSFFMKQAYYRATIIKFSNAIKKYFFYYRDCLHFLNQIILDSSQIFLLILIVSDYIDCAPNFQPLIFY